MKKIFSSKDHSFRAQIIFWLLVISLSSIFVVGIFSTVIIWNTAKDTYENNLYSELQDSNDVLRDLFNEISTKSLYIAFNREIWGNATSKDELNKFGLLKTIYETKILDSVKSIHIFNDINSYSLDGSDEHEELLRRINEYYEKAYSGTPYFWDKPIVTETQQLIPFIRRIKNYNTGEIVGLLVCCIDETQISNLVNASSLQANNENFADNILLINQENIIISSWDASFIGEVFDDLFEVDPSGANATRIITHERNLKVDHKDKLIPFKYVSIANYQKINATSKSIISIVFVVIIASTMGCIFASIIISKRLTQPIADLTATIDSMQEGLIEVNYSRHSNDEIGKLGQSFANMTRHLKQSIDENIQSHKLYQLAEYRALSSQINPHFLYNTISTIIYLIDSGHKDESIKMLVTLSALFRINVKENDGVITIREELEHVKNYLEIQQLRYKNQFQYYIDVEMDVYELYTVKIILQPLVENAIYHGILDNSDCGMIRVSGKRSGDQIVFEIIDNGGNLTIDDVEKVNKHINSQEVDNTQIGIGIKNVHDRIRFHFGDPYGVQLIKRGNLTISRVVIKALKEKLRNV